MIEVIKSNKVKKTALLVLGLIVAFAVFAVII